MFGWYVNLRNPSYPRLKSLSHAVHVAGRAPWDVMFDSVAPKVLNRLLFSKPTITEEEFWKVIQFSSFGDSHDRSHDLADQHAMFKQQLRFHFSTMAKDDPAFFSKFVHTCTGQSYIPDVKLNEDFRITIEFNFNELEADHLPVVHTCEKTIKLPAGVYNLDMEVFEAKLRHTMEHSNGIFDMQ